MGHNVDEIITFAEFPFSESPSPFRTKTWPLWDLFVSTAEAGSGVKKTKSSLQGLGRKTKKTAGGK
jgi:hypothetical protein